MTDEILSDVPVQEWLRNTERRLGRPLRVLHVGNIANNGYRNARIQRAHGIAADVLCADNYHIMSTPEWEDATFAAPPVDAFFPDWNTVDLQGYQRPRWFAAAPLADACRYLQAWVVGDAVAAERLWRVMERERIVRCSTSHLARLGLFRRKVGWKLAYEWQRLLARLGTAERNAEAAAIAHGGRGLAALNGEWARRRAGHPFPATTADLAHYWQRLRHIRRLLPLYDIVQGYAQEAIWALVGRHPYVACEHGTLRSLPFEDNATGRIVALVYGLADQVFVTNLDCLISADRMGLAPDRITPLPHPLDDERLTAFRAAHVELTPPADRLRLFMPSRQDWQDGDPNLAKGNDRFFRAAAQLAKQGLALEIIAVAWGRDLEASRMLANDLGLSAQVRWAEPMRKPDLWRSYMTSHAVIDQFHLPAFGNVTCEALALGRRVVTSLDLAAATRFFGVAPPLLACSTELEIAASLRRLAEDPADEAMLGQQAADWVATWHSARRDMELQVSVYRKMLDVAPKLDAAPNSY